MATLADMKARIAEETMRDDLANAIAIEITSAINFHRSKRFWFTEKLADVSFNTVINQSNYNQTANVNIPDLIRIDSITMNRDGYVRELDLVSEAQMKLWLGSSASMSGEPAYFSYYGRVLQVYPTPEKAYPIVIAGVIRVAAPANDAEEDNPWMNEAEELIRSRAASKIYANWMRDPQQGSVSRDQEAEALEALRVETSSRTQVDTIIPDCL